VLKKDICNYSVTKHNKELLSFDELGVKKNGSEHVIYNKIGDNEYVIQFDNIPYDSKKGLSLFALAVLNILDKSKHKRFSVNSYEDISNLQKVAIDTISKSRVP
jgi:uncharacterized protein YwqG